jgi:hypothetical protein
MFILRVSIFSSRNLVVAGELTWVPAKKDIKRKTVKLDAISDDFFRNE